MAEDSVILEDFETFKESFSQAIREDNLEVQIDMTKKLGILAEHIGENLIRNQLLPFIKENMDFHNEILFNLSDQLKEFIPLVGGYENSQPILDLFKNLCNADETLVREKTVETLKSIAEELDSELTEQLLVPLLESLANEDWFTSRCSAVSLFPIIYSKVKDERKEELRHNFRLLSQDDSPIVRKTAAICLIDLIPIMDIDSLKNEFISVFDNISNDNIDSVQVHSIKIAIALCKRLIEPEIEEFVFKKLENFAANTSWKIRQVLALNIAEIQEVIPFPKFRGRILAMFQTLVKDTEEEVRILAVNNFVKYCRNLKASYDQPNVENNFEAVFVESILPQIALVVVDPSLEVKLALTKNILSLSNVISKELFMEHIMPIVVDVLEEERCVPVKAGILESLNDLPPNIDFAKSLPSIKKVVRTLIVYSQSHWRTRKGLLVTFMHISRFASKEYFSENLKIFYASLLGDPVFAVRRTAPIILPLIAKRYSIAWTAKHIIPYFKMFTKDSRYLYRYVPLFGINELINPSIIQQNDINYLNNFKESTVTSKPKLLFKLRCSLSKLSSKLEEKTFKDILSLNNSIDDFKTDNISLYAGDTVTSLAQYSQDIFDYNAEKPNEWYMTGLISLIYRDFLELILYLFDDKIVNVQIRSIFTLNKIKMFTDKLAKELKQPWVEECLKLLTKEETDTIEQEVEIELNKTGVELDEEKIDTDLMENILTASESSTNLTETADAKVSVPVINIEYADESPASEIEIIEVDTSDSQMVVSEVEESPVTKNTEDCVVHKEDTHVIHSINEKLQVNESNSETSEVLELKTDTEQETSNIEKAQEVNEQAVEVHEIAVENIEKETKITEVDKPEQKIDNVIIATNDDVK